MDDTTSTNPATPAPTDPAAGSNPISGPAPSDMGGSGQQSTADEQSTVQSQVNDFASGAPAAPAGDSGMPAPGGSSSTDGSSTEGADVPVTPPPADPAAGTDPMAPPASGDGSSSTPA